MLPTCKTLARQTSDSTNTATPVKTVTAQELLSVSNFKLYIRYMTPMNHNIRFHMITGSNDVKLCFNHIIRSFFPELQEDCDKSSFSVIDRDASLRPGFVSVCGLSFSNSLQRDVGLRIMFDAFGRKTLPHSSYKVPQRSCVSEFKG